MNTTDTAELIRVATDALIAGIPLDAITGRPHECNVRCQGVEHVSLVYHSAGTPLASLLTTGRKMYRRYPIIPLRYEQAPEYPPLSTTPLSALYRARGHRLMDDTSAEGYLMVWRYRKGGAR